MEVADRTSRPSPTRAAVLVVDDEEMIRVLCGRVLDDQHDVTTSPGAQDALGLITAGARFDVILCDLSMPGMSGMDLHEELSRTLPEQALAMVFLTGGAFTDRARQFLDDVPNRWVQKPMDNADLRLLVNEQVDRRRRNAGPTSPKASPAGH